MHWRHKWSDWAVIERGSISDPWNHPVGHYLKQERFCRTCGKVDIDISRQERCPFVTHLVPERRGGSHMQKDGVA